MRVKSESEVAQSCLTLSNPKDYIAHQALPSMGFSKQEYRSGVPLPSPIFDDMGEIIAEIILNACLLILFFGRVLESLRFPNVCQGD